MATESEQVRILRENELLRVELAEATDNFATYYRVAQERQDDLEQVQAKIERLKMTLVDRESLIAEYIMTEEQAQARAQRLEEAGRNLYMASNSLQGVVDGVDNGYCRICRGHRLTDGRGLPQRCERKGCQSTRLNEALDGWEAALATPSCEGDADAHQS